MSPGVCSAVRGPLVAGAVALYVGLAAAGSASAAPIRDCGDLAHSGAGIYNVTSRGVSCSFARRFAKRLPSRAYRSVSYFHGWTCRTTILGEELADTRCTRGARVVRWQSGA